MVKTTNQAEREPENENEEAALVRPVYNKIALDGMGADLEGFAFKSGSTPEVAQLWYLSVVGHRQAVEAIWAGLVNTPPKWASMYCEETEDPVYLGLSAAKRLAYRQAKPPNLKVQLAPRPEAQGWLSSKCHLDKANAAQIALFPLIGFDEVPAKVRDKVRLPQSSSSGADPTHIEQFVLLLPSSRTSETSPISRLTTSPPDRALDPGQAQARHLYWRRLNRLSRLPLHASWADWLWRTGLDNAEIQLLPALSCQVWLCQQPNEERLGEALSQALRTGELKL